MVQQSVIAVFDIGKTNKKVFLIDEQYQVVWENAINLDEIEDEDGFPCENVQDLSDWVINNYHLITQLTEYAIKAVNFSAYGASFVHLDSGYKVCSHLYNYLKPFPSDLQHQFYQEYDPNGNFAIETSSPVLGNLNSGMQLYYLKYKKPEHFQRIKYSLHLPQYLSFLIGNQIYSEITSIGCHTNLWDFNKNQYHSWVEEEGFSSILPPIHKQHYFINSKNNAEIKYVGTGLHDSSAALAPYLISCKQPFVLISTGTWCISLNPFNHSVLTKDELEMDCLCYLTYEGKPVKSSRLFAGNEHEIEVKRLSIHYNKPIDYFKNIGFDAEIFDTLKLAESNVGWNAQDKMTKESRFKTRDLINFETYEMAYHQLMIDLVEQQVFSTQLVIQDTQVQHLYVDGGFSKNEIYMSLLAIAFPKLKVFASIVSQASSIGAALIIHKTWNSKPIPNNIIQLKPY
jgi:L-fuculokinase